MSMNILSVRFKICLHLIETITKSTGSAVVMQAGRALSDLRGEYSAFLTSFCIAKMHKKGGNKKLLIPQTKQYVRRIPC